MIKVTSENKISSELDVSRVAVRQAMDKLIALGLLNKRKGSGTYVNKIKPEHTLII